MYKKIKRKIDSIGFKNVIFFMARRFFDVIFRSDNLFFRCNLLNYQAPVRFVNKDVRVIEKKSFDEITDLDRKNLIELADDRVLSVFEKRLAEGDRLFIAYINSEMAGLCWVNCGCGCRFYSIPLSDSIPLSAKEFMLTSSYTIDKFRQRGVSTALIIEILSKMKQEGYQQGFGVTKAWNFNRKAFLKVGFNIFGRFREFKLLRKNILIWTSVESRKLE